MTAVQISHLHQEIKRIIRYIDQPHRFHEDLTELFEFYSDRAYRPGLEVQTNRMFPSYRIPAILIQQIKNEIKRYARSKPTEALLLADELWLDTYFEVNQLSVFILEDLPEAMSPLILDRYDRWTSVVINPLLFEQLSTRISLKILAEKSERWLDIINQFLDNRERESQEKGILALIFSVQWMTAEQMLRCTRILMNYIQSEGIVDIPFFYDLIRQMANKYPQETFVFLRNMVTIQDNPKTNRLARKSLPFFDEIQQKQLREAFSRYE